MPDEAETADDPRPGTRILEDASRSIISTNMSPDVGLDASLNPYRGCEHGCAYCYARPTHEYLGFSAGLDFETRIVAKRAAPELLRATLSSRRWRPRPLLMSGVTDPYQPLERKLRITRGCLEVLAEARHPVAVITKNHLVTRDIDLLAELARFDAVTVIVSITSLDRGLQGAMEPRTSTPARRLDAVRALSDAGIPVSVNLAPVIPALNDHEIPRILAAAAQAGARSATYILLRLPHGVRELFEDWLRRHRPDRAERVLNRMRDLRGGDLYRARFGERMRGTGPWADQLRSLFEVSRRRVGLEPRSVSGLSVNSFRRPGSQRDLFDG